MIKIKKGYLLHEIAGVPYLLPYGQNIADFQCSIRLNESGLLLYHALLQGAKESSLPDMLKSHYHASDADLPALKEDVAHFLLQLEAANILTRSNISTPEYADFFFHIGPAAIAYHGPEELLVPSLFDFSCEQATPDLSIRILSYLPGIHENGELLVRTDELIVCKNEISYLFLYPADYGIAEMHISLDGRQATLFCPQPYKNDLPEKIFHAFRFAYLIRVQQMGEFALHSASILYQDRAWLFSGSSGSGKSTRTALWMRQYHTPYLNGDLNLLGFVDDMPVVYGIPWCGTSGSYTTQTVPLGGITFLKQASANALMPLTAEEISLRTMQRLISPSWTKDMLLSNLSFTEKIKDAVSFFHLHCTKETSAAALMKQTIDTYTETKDLSSKKGCRF